MDQQGSACLPGSICCALFTDCVPVLTTRILNTALFISVAQSLELEPGMNLEAIAKKLDGYSGDDITNICRDAAMNGIRRLMSGRTPAEMLEIRQKLSADAMKQPVTMQDFEEVSEMQ